MMILRGHECEEQLGPKPENHRPGNRRRTNHRLRECGTRTSDGKGGHHEHNAHGGQMFMPQACEGTRGTEGMTGWGKSEGQDISSTLFLSNSWL